MKTISDSTILIHLAKIGKIHYLKEIFDQIIIPKEVYYEVMEKGKELEKNEIELIKNLIENKFIIIKEVKNIIEITNLNKGEREALSLCKELNINSLIIDETEGFNVANILNINPIRTTSILIILLDKKIINFDEYKLCLKELSETRYFLDAVTYDRLLEIGRNIG